jgi:hypothetical protein
MKQIIKKNDINTRRKVVALITAFIITIFLTIVVIPVTAGEDASSAVRKLEERQSIYTNKSITYSPVCSEAGDVSKQSVPGVGH